MGCGPAREHEETRLISRDFELSIVSLYEGRKTAPIGKASFMMKTEQTTSKPEMKACEVCEKRTATGERFAHIEHEGQLAVFCSPFCFAIFQRQPKPFIASLLVRRLLQPCPSSHRRSA